MQREVKFKEIQKAISILMHSKYSINSKFILAQTKFFTNVPIILCNDLTKLQSKVLIE